MEINMNQDYLKNWATVAGEMQKPFRAILNLNVKMLQDLRFLRLDDFSTLHQPGELLDKQVHLAMENSHRVLDYMQESFHIMEQAFSTFSQELEESTKKTIARTRSEFLKSRMLPESMMAIPKLPKTRKTTAKKRKVKTATVSAKSRTLSTRGKKTAAKSTIKATNKVKAASKRTVQAANKTTKPKTKLRTTGISTPERKTSPLEHRPGSFASKPSVSESKVGSPTGGVFGSKDKNPFQR
jgi:hypothetical protein